MSTDQLDLSSILSAIESLSSRFDARFDSIEKKMTSFESTMEELRTRTESFKSQLSETMEENRKLKRESYEMKASLNDMENKLHDMEARARRNNLIFHGLGKEKEQENWKDTEALVRKLISEKLEIDDSTIKIERAHRIHNSNGPGPIIVKFLDFNDKENILRAHGHLKKTNIFINEDYTARVRQTRKKLSPFLTKYRSEGKRANLVYDHLIVDGERYDFDPDSDSIYSARRPRRETQDSGPYKSCNRAPIGSRERQNRTPNPTPANR
ncbi:SH3 domain protein [Elysia marginata]|uniref:SH3 domain protein n=1 Tax=Elysia marginata TaxID=1093978 RepID=A0AAV4IKL4_9GAST|nr:SH3 domain protein [Elysia marginata]